MLLWEVSPEMWSWGPPSCLNYWELPWEFCRKGSPEASKDQGLYLLGEGLLGRRWQEEKKRGWRCWARLQA